MYMNAMAKTNNDYDIRRIPGISGYYATTEGMIWKMVSQEKIEQDTMTAKIYNALGIPFSKKKTDPSIELAPASMCINNGYIVATISGIGKPCYWRPVHQLILETFVGIRPEGYHTRHLNGDKMDNRLSNLCWGTASENREDTVRHKREKELSQCV
jgi:hypothetical protein